MQHWREGQTIRIDVSDLSFPHRDDQTPRRATWQYMKRRVRRLLRELGEVKSEHYFPLLASMLHESQCDTIDPASQWAAMDALFSGGTRWHQPQSGRGPYKLTGPKFVRKTREERAPEIWNAHLEEVKRLYLNIKVPAGANAAALRVLWTNKQNIPAISKEQAARFLESDEPILTAVATRFVAANWNGAGDWLGAMVAAALLQSGGPARRKLGATLETVLQNGQPMGAWREEFAARLAQELDTQSTPHRRRAAASWLAGRFRDNLATDAVFRHLALFLEGDDETAQWALDQVRKSDDLKHLDDIARLPENIRERAVSAFLENLGKLQLSFKDAQSLVTNGNYAHCQIGWRVLAATNTQAKELRELWQAILSDYYAGESTMRAALENGAPIELWRRAQWSPEKLLKIVEQNWWRWSRHYGVASFEWYQAMIESLPPADKLANLFYSMAYLSPEIAARVVESYGESARDWKPSGMMLERGLKPATFYTTPISLSAAFGFLLHSAVAPEELRSVWRAIFSNEFGPEAAQLFRRAQILPDEITKWLSEVPSVKAQFSPQFFLAVIELAPDETKTPLIVEASAEQWNGVRAALIWMLREDENLLASFWRGVWSPLGESEPLRARIIKDAELATTFSALPDSAFDELLPRAQTEHAPLILAWLNNSTASRGDERIIVAATHPVDEIREWGLKKVCTLGLDLPVSLRLMEAGLPSPFALGREYLESDEEEDASDVALALCDSPAAQVREFGREFILARRDELLNESLLQKLAQHPDAMMQTWLAEELRDDDFEIKTSDFDAAILRSRGRARRAKEAVKERLNNEESTASLEIGTLLELARGSTLAERDWALQQLARRALAGEKIEGVIL